MRIHTLIVAASSLLNLSQAKKYPEVRASLVTYNDADCSQPAQRIDLEPSTEWERWGMKCIEDLQPGLLPVAYKIIGKKNLKRQIAGHIIFFTDTQCAGAATGSK